MVSTPIDWYNSGMRDYIIRRIILLIPVLFGVVTLVFLLVHFIPGDPVDLMLGDQAVESDKEILRHHLGLDKPILEQYIDYIGGIIKGDLGTSIVTRQPVSLEIKSRFPATALLAIVAMLCAILISFPIGLAAGWKQYSFTDTVAMFFSLIGVSMPNFWLGPLLIILFSVYLGWLPVSGSGSPAHIILPALTLGASMAAILSRMLRSSLIEIKQMDYIRTARAKGVSEGMILVKHALRNALIPVITITGLQIGALLSGAIITEQIFDWPGIGTLLLSGINHRNYPIVQGCVLVIASIYVVVNLVTDICYAYVDPRIRLS
jgi:peptide/nickel transport system permease protein